MNSQVSIASELVVAQFQRDFPDNLRSVRGVDLDVATPVDFYQALAATVSRYLLPPALDRHPDIIQCLWPSTKSP